MPEPSVFDWVSEALLERTSLGELTAGSESARRLTVRGTLRQALKKAGLKSGSVVPSEMAVVLRSVLPGELDRRGLEKSLELCQGLIEEMNGMSFAEAARPNEFGGFLERV